MTFSTTGTISPGNWVDFDDPNPVIDFEVIVNVPSVPTTITAVYADGNCGTGSTLETTGGTPTCNGCTNVITVQATNPASGVPMWLVIVY
jgi:hypothetical protein